MGILVFGAVIVAAYREADRFNRPPRPERFVWKTGAEFHGKQSGRTRRFTVSGAPWRLTWKTNGSTGGSSAAITIMPASRDLEPVFERNGIAAPGSGSIVINRSGEYYVIVSASEGEWTLMTETYERATYRRHRPLKPLTAWERFSYHVRFIVDEALD